MPELSSAAARPLAAARGAAGPAVRVALLALLAAACAWAYLYTDLSGARAYILERRTMALTGMVLVGVAVAVATVAFHAVTANQVLAPSVMGLDSLYVLVQTVAAVALGAAGWAAVDPVLRFAGQTVLLVGLSVLLYRWLLLGRGGSLPELVLTGVVLGGVFRALSGLLQRLMDPTQFLALQSRLFASFTSVDRELLWPAAVLIALPCAWLWWRRKDLDVIALGPQTATVLGLDHRRVAVTVLAVTAVLVSASTALVGPTSFFGLLAAHLGYQAVGTFRHAWTLPAAALAAVVALVGGQLLFERVLGLAGTLSLVVELIGGTVLIIVLVRRSRA